MRYFRFLSFATQTMSVLAGLGMLVFTALGEPDNGLYSGASSLLLGLLSVCYSQLSKPSAWSAHAK